MKSNWRRKSGYIVQKTTVINALPGDIFGVLMNVGEWKQWTPSITDMYIPDGGRPGTGTSIKILQPKLPPAVWTITEILPDRSITWEKRSFGLVMQSEHLLLAGNTATSVTIRMTYGGGLAGLIYMLTHSLTDRYMTMEINGLKRKCEKR